MERQNASRLAKSLSPDTTTTQAVALNLVAKSNMACLIIRSVAFLPTNMRWPSQSQATADNVSHCAEKQPVSYGKHLLES